MQDIEDKYLQEINPLQYARLALSAHFMITYQPYYRLQGIWAYSHQKSQNDRHIIPLDTIFSFTHLK